MNGEYKVILSKDNFYREIHLDNNLTSLYIGNTDGCDILLEVESDVPAFFLLLTKKEADEWELTCSEQVYISAEGILKQITRILAHGDNFAIKYNYNNSEILKFSFIFDFELEKQDYHRVIELDGYSKSHITVGGDDNYDICIYDDLMKDCDFCFLIQNDTLYVDNIRCRYGIYLNGNIIKRRTEIKDCDFITILGYSFYYRNHLLRTTNNGNVKIHNLSNYAENISEGNKKYPMFYRNTRVLKQPYEEKMNILSPPKDLDKPQDNILRNLLPALGTLALTIVIRGIIGGGGTFVIFSVCTMSMGIATSIASFIGSKRAYKKGKKEREEKYNRYISGKRKEIEQKRKAEKDYLDELYISEQQQYRRVMDFSSDLFYCQKQDIDYLNIRLGTGRLESKEQLEYKKLEQLEIEDNLSLIPEQLSEEYKYISDVPITCNLSDIHALGIVCSDFHMKELVNNIIVEIVSKHFHTDVKLILICNEEHIDYIYWARLLPHVNEEHMRYIVCDEESRKNVFEFMYQIFSMREEEKDYSPEYVVLALDEMGIKTHPVSRYISHARDYGVTFVFFEENEDRLPMGCNRIIRMTDNKREGVLIESKDEGKQIEFRYTPISDRQARDIAVKLAPVYTEEVSLENSLIRNITLFELLQIQNVKKINLNERWNSSNAEQSLKAPLGVNAKHEIVNLDLHEKAHGPHGLVAGTTGSGKSEILQSYILSMATLYHPYEVSFMIIDFKGGGMVNQFKNLPHLIGAITNIDGKEIDRSLKSIKAELKKRQRCFAEAEVNHIDAYIRKFKLGEVREIIPHLIVIVDEFAELKAEQPEFMKELISAARIGRSLGVHLILATQKPAGQVNEQIWSNSKFKLCLKVQNKEDSNEVLKSPLAAEIKEPGRAYLQVGNNEIFELFQSAYSGAPADLSINNDRKEFHIDRVALSGKRTTVYEYKKKKSEEETRTQLNAIVDYIANYCHTLGIRRVPSICLPPLPERLDYETYDMDGINPIDKFNIPIGTYDDPDNQYQGAASINVLQNNTAIIGSSQYGKTNLLMVLIRYLTEHCTPDEFTFYALDFGSRVLTIFEDLNHCGGIVCPGEDEKFINLIKFLHTEMGVRKEKLLKYGVTSYGAYLESGNNDMPLIMIIIDNFTSLKELYLNDKDVLLNICRDGASLGITMAVANSITSGIGFRYLSNFANKIAFYCNDQNEYNNLFEFCRERPAPIPGRCLIEVQKKKYECQTMIAFAGEKEIERADEMRKFISLTREYYGENRGKRIPVIPKVLYRAMLMNMYHDQNAYRYPIGLNYSDVKPCEINLLDTHMLAITGREKMGQSNFVMGFLKHFENYPDIFNVFLVDDIHRKLAEAEKYQCVKRYTYMPDDAIGMIDEIHGMLQERFNQSILTGGLSGNISGMTVLILNNPDCVTVLNTKKESMEKYKAIITRYKNLGIFVLLSHLPNTSITYNAPEILKAVKDSKTCIAFEDINMVKMLEVSPTQTREFKKTIESGEAYFIQNASIRKIKTAFN